MTVTPEETSAAIAVLREKQAQQEAAQLEVLRKLDLILAKFDLLPDIYLPRRDWVDFKVEFARVGLAADKRLDAVDSRADTLRMWLIGALGATAISLALGIAPHVGK